MKKILFSLLAIGSIFFITENVSALTLSKPTGYAHESFRPSGVNVQLPILESSNSFGYANYAMDFIRNRYLNDPDTNITYENTYYNWYGFVFNDFKNKCGNNPVLLKGHFVTWTNFIPGIFSNSPYVIFTNSNNENTNCSIVSSNNSNVLEFSCLVENMTSTGSFNIGFNDPGRIFNGSMYLESYNSYVGISKNLELSCQISTSDILNIQNQNKNEIINNQNQNKNEIIDNQNKNQQQTNEKLDNLNQNITDSTPPNLSGLGESAGWLPAGPVDSIINLPLSFMQNLSNSLSKQCKPIELDIPFLPGNQKMKLPCMNTIYDQIPNFNILWNWLGVVASALILYNYLLGLYKWVDDRLTFKENNEPDWGGI